jgi:ferric iron reductase protein FhuF
MIALLEPIFRGQWAPYGETLVCGPGPGTVQHTVLLADFLNDTSLLDDTFARYARHLKSQDRRALVSAWSLDYFSALLPAVIAAASVLQHEFPVSPAEIALILDLHGKPLAFSIPHEGTSRAGQNTAQRYEALVWQHLAPLIERLARHNATSPRLLWANAARYVGEILDHAELAAFAGVAADRAVLLLQPAWPEGRPNPLFGKPRASRLHRQCCLYYLLPDQGYCRDCPRAATHKN